MPEPYATPRAVDYRTVDLASNLVTHFIEPALSGDAEGKTWSPGSLAWV